MPSPLSSVLTVSGVHDAYVEAAQFWFNETLVPVLYSLHQGLIRPGDYPQFGFEKPILFNDGTWVNSWRWQESSFDAILQLFWGLLLNPDFKVWVNNVLGFATLSKPLGPYPHPEPFDPSTEPASDQFRSQFPSLIEYILERAYGHRLFQGKQRVKGVFFANKFQLNMNPRDRQYRRFPYRVQPVHPPP